MEKEALFGMGSIGTLNTWQSLPKKSVGHLEFQHVHGRMLDLGWQRN